MAQQRRHLPVLKSSTPAGDPPEEERPPWHWVAIGAVLIFTAWLPLAMAGQWVSSRLIAGLVPGGTAADVRAFLGGASAGLVAAVHGATLGPPLLCFGAACAAGGALVGRFGGKAGRKEAALSGLVAATAAWALTAAGLGLGASWFLWPPVALLGLAFAYAGGRWGLGRRA